MAARECKANFQALDEYQAIIVLFKSNKIYEFIAVRCLIPSLILSGPLVFH
jgi:hypothetical protein